MTAPGRRPARPGIRPAAEPVVPCPRPGDKDMGETTEPYDPPFPDTWPAGRPEYVVVVDQLRGWQPDLPPSLAELLDTAPARTREPEPDLSRTVTPTRK